MTTMDEERPLPPVSEVFPHLFINPAILPKSLDPFTVTTATGFLPIHRPQELLPAVFEPLTKLVETLPIVILDGKSGLLGNFKLGPTIDGGSLPDLTKHIDNLVTEDGKHDLSAITALFRDYSFLASAYLLEPCWEMWCKDHSAGYGLGRQTLPKEIAAPLVKTAKILDLPPFMSYAAAYALYNYKLDDARLGTEVYSNLRLIRAFERGLDPASSEAGFVLTHVHMVSNTGPLISGAMDLLHTIEHSPNNRDEAITALTTMLSAMSRIEASMEQMWSHSQPKDYISYRTFIFGITNQSMFPDGVVYQGCFDDQRQFFRGESGANDSIIPLLDNLCQIPMPANPLTDILKDFRNYRPRQHRLFLSYVESKATELGVREYCSGHGMEVAALFLRLLDHVRSFRWRHWLFAREYIIKRSRHPTATGGSPIVTWLPNQLGAVMELMQDVYVRSGLERRVQEGRDGMKGLARMMDKVAEQKVRLDKEVERYCLERGGQQ